MSNTFIPILTNLYKLHSPLVKKKVYSYKQKKKPWISTGTPTACQTKEFVLRMIEG